MWCSRCCETFSRSGGVLNVIFVVVSVAMLLTIFLVVALSLRLRQAEIETMYRLGCSRLKMAPIGDSGIWRHYCRELGSGRAGLTVPVIVVAGHLDAAVSVLNDCRGKMFGSPIIALARLVSFGG